MSRTPADKLLIYACERFVKGWPNFCKRIDFNHSNLDAKAIRFFNEVPGEISRTLETKKGEQTDDQI